MERKDLILLLLIPILLIITLSFFQSPEITGYATAKDEESNYIGAYYIMPSFKAKINYNYDDYKDINQKLKTAMQECNKRKDIDTCIRDKTEKFGWNCEINDEIILYDFIDKLKDCKNLKEEKAVCKFALDDRKSINEAKNERNFEIRLTDWYPPRIKAEFIEDKKVIKTEYVELGGLYITGFNDRDEETEKLKQITIKINYKDGKPIILEAYASSDKSSKIDISKIFLLYKTKDFVKFIDLAEEKSFLAPDPEKKIGLPEIIELPRVKGLKFCVKSGKYFNLYDADENKVNQKEIIYKFAITFPKSPPKQASFEVLDAKHSENSVILEWSKSTEAGIKSYNIYYSKKDFLETKIDDINKDKEIKKLNLQTDNPIKSDKNDLANCNFDPVGEPCKYAGYNKALEAGKLYFTSDNKFIYLINNVEDGVEYNFAVTAVNDEGDTIDNDKSLEGNTNILELNKNYKKLSSVDDLAPDKVTNLKYKMESGKVKLTWDKPSKNLDGSKAIDVEGFSVYYDSGTLNFDESKLKITALDAKCEGNDINCEYTLELKKGNYNLALIAFDENSNQFTKNADVISVIVP